MEVTIIFAFVAGFVSFLAPCVLPILPGFLAYLAGGSIEETKSKRLQIFVNAVFFVLGFSLVFALVGVALNTILEAIAYDVLVWLSRIGGIIVIFFGLYLMGLFHIRFLDREHKLRVSQNPRWKLFSSFLFGAAFAAGWTPCVGAVLGAILGLAATQPGSAFFLLLSYAVGFGIPFLVFGLFTAELSRFTGKLARWSKPVNIVFGILLIVLGVLLFTQTLARIASFPFLDSLYEQIYVEAGE